MLLREITKVGVFIVFVGLMMVGPFLLMEKFDSFIIGTIAIVIVAVVSMISISSLDVIESKVNKLFD